MNGRRRILALAGGAVVAGAIGRQAVATLPLPAASQVPTEADFLAACYAHPERVMPAFRHILRMRDGMTEADSLALLDAELEAVA